MPSKIAVLKAWPHVLAWRKRRTHPTWEHFRPKIGIPGQGVEARIRCLEENEDEYGQKLLFVPPDLVKSRRVELAWLKWYAAIPAEARNLVKIFPKRQWHMLSFLARCGKPASELAAANPALAWAMASNWVFHHPAVKQPLRSARIFLRKRQREILAWLSFPPTEGARRIISKVIPQAVNVYSLLSVREAMNDPVFLRPCRI